jgi:hypothetical protein
LEVSRLLKISCFLYAGFLHGERGWAAKKGYRPPKQKKEKGNKPTQIHLKPGSLRDFRAQNANSRTLKKGKETETAAGRFIPALQGIKTCSYTDKITPPINGHYLYMCLIISWILF